MALYPEDATLQAWTRISEAREFSGLPVAVFEALQSMLGSLSDALRNIAILPADFWTEAIAAARLSGEDKRQLRNLWSSAAILSQAVA